MGQQKAEKEWKRKRKKTGLKGRNTSDSNIKRKSGQQTGRGGIISMLCRQGQFTFLMVKKIAEIP